MTSSIPEWRDQAEDTENIRGLALVLAATAFYVFLHVGFRLATSNVLGEDDVFANVLSQELAVGYDTFPRQPPLYNWLLWLIQQLTGPTLFSFLLIKYGALIATVALLYLSAKRILKSHIYAVLSVEALALIYSISWRFHEGFTHQVLAMLATAAALYVMLKLIDRGSRASYILFGITLGLGLLTERVFGVFILALLLALTLQPSLRMRIQSGWLAVSFLIAGMILTPYAWWVLSEPHRITDWFMPLAKDMQQYWRGVIDALRGPFFYLSPLIVFVPIMFPKALPAAWQDMRRAPNCTEQPDLLQWLWHTALIGFLLSILGALLLQVGKQPVHAFMPLYITSVIWMFGVVKASLTDKRQIKWFAWFALMIATIALVARLANLFVMHPVCNKCRWGIPYDQLAQVVRDKGFSGEKIIVFEPELAGNLRQLFPNKQIVLLGAQTYVPPAAELNKGQRAYIWNEKFGDYAAKTFFGPTLPNGGEFPIEAAELQTVPWQHLWRETGYHTTSWRVLVTGEKR